MATLGMGGKKLVCVAVGFAAVVSTLVDRLDHRQYATSQACQNETLVAEGGRFAKLHCMYHSEQWSSPSRWIEHARDIFVPSVGGEIKMAVGYAILNVMSWINWFVGIAVAVCAYRCVNIVYYHCSPGSKPPVYKCA